jgi:EpsI family protein
LTTSFRHTVAALGFSGSRAVDGLILAYVVVVLWFSWTTLASLHLRWTDFGYSHGYLVLLLVAMLFARELRSESCEVGSGSAIGLGVLVLCLLVMIGAYASSVMLVAQLMLPILWVAAVWSVAGWPVARRFVPAFSYLYFAVPIWDFLNTPLQELTIVVVSWGVDLLHIPAVVDGNSIHIPSGTFEVEGGCSGLHYFIVGLALATLCGTLHQESSRARWILIALALVLSLAANWVRVLTIIVAGHLTDMQHFLIVKDHYYFGWALFFVFFVPVFLADRYLQREPGEVDARLKHAHGRARWSGARVTLLSLAVLTVGVASSIQKRIGNEPERDAQAVAVVLPAFGEWAEEGEWHGESRPSFLGVSGATGRWYAKGSARVGVYVGTYLRQREGQEAVFYSNRAEGQAAEIVARDRVSAAGASGVQLPFTELEVMDSTSSRRLVWSGVRVAGFNVTSTVAAKALQAAGVFLGRRDAQVLVLTAACAGTCESAKSLLAEFAAAAAEAAYESGEHAAAAN